MIGIGAGARVLCPVVSGAGVVAVGVRLSVKRKAANPAMTSTAITVGSTHSMVSGSLMGGATWSRRGSESRGSKFFGGRLIGCFSAFALDLQPLSPISVPPNQKKLRLRGNRGAASMLQRRMFRSFGSLTPGRCFLSPPGTAICFEACFSEREMRRAEKEDAMATSMTGSNENRETHDLIGSDKVEGTNVYRSNGIRSGRSSG